MEEVKVTWHVDSPMSNERKAYFRLFDLGQGEFRAPASDSGSWNEWNANRRVLEPLRRVRNRALPTPAEFVEEPIPAKPSSPAELHKDRRHFNQRRWLATCK